MANGGDGWCKKRTGGQAPKDTEGEKDLVVFFPCE